MVGEFSDDMVQWRARVGAAVHYLRYLTSPRNDRSDTLYSISVKAKTDYHDNWLVVGRRVGDNGYEVAFHESETPDGAITGFIERMLRNDLKWHPDKYAEERS